jgi:hypothetical protein
VWGVGLSHEILNVAGAEPVFFVEGHMCGAVMRGAVALPGSKATSRTKGSRRNLGDLTPGHRPCAILVRMRAEQEESACEGAVLPGGPERGFEPFDQVAAELRSMIEADGVRS